MLDEAGGSRGAFDFSPDASSKENIDNFLAHLETVDAEFARLLKRNIGELLPLPEQSGARTRARKAFNAKVLEFLDSQEFSASVDSMPGREESERP